MGEGTIATCKWLAPIPSGRSGMLEFAAMFLALRELRREIIRFALLIVSIALLVFLILFQQAIQSGLISAFVGAIENQSAPVVVYSVDGRRSLQGSLITPDLEATIRATPGIERAGTIGQGTFTVELENSNESNSDAAASDSVVLIGYSDAELGRPTKLQSGRYPTAPGEVIANANAQGDDFTLGSTVRIVPGDTDLTIVGTAASIDYLATNTLFGTFDTYQAAVAATNPDAKGVLPNALVLQPARGTTPAQLAQAINSNSPDADALTRADAAALTPGVAQVQASFRVIFFLYGLVVPLVAGLFFLIVTLQKANSLTLLRAIGAPAGRLISSLIVQVTIVMGLGIALGIALYMPLSNADLGGIALRFRLTPVLIWAVSLLCLGLLSALFSARRVLRIDPIEATTGAGVRS